MTTQENIFITLKGRPSSHPQDFVAYELLFSQREGIQESIPLNSRINAELLIHWTGYQGCLHCGTPQKKLELRGYCRACTYKLAECDRCIYQPQFCHFSKGTCRDPQWAQGHCFIPHVVYLAMTSQLKVGIAREVNTPYRWIDQGASLALPIFRVGSRYEAGLVEVLLAKGGVSDRTSWKQMILQGNRNPSLDLESIRDALFDDYAEDLDSLAQGAVRLEILENSCPYRPLYPIHQIEGKEFLPVAKLLSLSPGETFRKKLMGIKGQYLLFEDGVINTKNLAGYQLSIGSI